MELKKFVWQWAVAKRKSIDLILKELASRGGHGAELSAEQVLAYKAELEALRESQGETWTFFEEDL